MSETGTERRERTSDEVLESLDWEPEHACEYIRKESSDPCGAPAELLVVTAAFPDCGCAATRFFCTPCWVRRSRAEMVFCRAHDGERIPPWSNVARVERVR